MIQLLQYFYSGEKILSLLPTFLYTSYSLQLLNTSAVFYVFIIRKKNSASAGAAGVVLSQLDNLH
jgi:hypothetical protein